MRIDKFINATNIVKRRQIAQDMCENNAVLLNDKIAKSSKEVKIGDIITLVFLDKKTSYEVLEIPTLKATPKKDQSKYIKIKD